MNQFARPARFMRRMQDDRLPSHNREGNLDAS